MNRFTCFLLGIVVGFLLGVFGAAHNAFAEFDADNYIDFCDGCLEMRGGNGYSYTILESPLRLYYTTDNMFHNYYSHDCSYSPNFYFGALSGIDSDGQYRYSRQSYVSLETKSADLGDLSIGKFNTCYYKHIKSGGDAYYTSYGGRITNDNAYLGLRVIVNNTFSGGLVSDIQRENSNCNLNRVIIESGNFGNSERLDVITSDSSFRKFYNDRTPILGKSANLIINSTDNKRLSVFSGGGHEQTSNTRYAYCYLYMEVDNIDYAGIFNIDSMQFTHETINDLEFFYVSQPDFICL